MDRLAGPSYTDARSESHSSRGARFMMQDRAALSPLRFGDVGERGLLLASATTPWAGIPFEVQDLPEVDGSWEGGAPPLGELGMMVMLQGTQIWELQGRPPQSRITARPGLLSFADPVCPPKQVSRTIGQGRGIVFSLRELWKERLIADGGPESFARLVPLAPSQTVLSLAVAISSEVESGAPNGAMFAEALSLAIIRYAIGGAPVSNMRVRGSISDAQRRRIARYVDDNLHRDVGLVELSGLTGLRPRHFSTLFRRAFGITPYQYLILRRVEHGARLLATTNADVVEIALHVGFSSQSHFAVAFRKHYGLTPRRYALSCRASISG